MRATILTILISVFFVVLLLGLVAASPTAPAAASPTAPAAASPQPELSDEEFFETKVKPILIGQCFQCHGAGKKIKGGLRINTREEFEKGGDNGPGFVAGSPDDSLSVIAVLYTDEDFVMPPAAKMEDEQIQTFVEWIRRGAPWSGGPLPKPEIDPTLDDEADEDDSDDEAPAPATPEEREFFAKRILPVLDKHCFRCHGGKKRVKGDLHLTSLEGMKRGGYGGPAVVSRKPEESLLIQAVRYTDMDLAMPPDYKLSDLEIADLYTWIKAGAVWPDGVELSGDPEKKDPEKKADDK